MASVKEVDHCRVIQVFLWSVAALCLCAFTSLYAQIPGLYGKSGIYPAEYVLDDKRICHDNDRRCKNWSEQKQCHENAEWMLENCAKSCNACKSGLGLYMNFPTLLWYTSYLRLTTETGMEFICLLGILLSFCMLLCRAARDSINFLLLWILYFSLVQVGQIFLYYQWDNLLLEMSFLAALVAPWNLYIGAWNFLTCKRVDVYVQREHDLIMWWLVKWLLFRLMFASGIVKLLWMDETWWNLTALNWHYESQCIPTPLAWYMQKLPTAFHRLSVVFTYLIEIVVPFLFFAPVRCLRIFAFFAQMLLQTMILFTGNYNFFNLATMALCLSLVDDKFLNFHVNIMQLCKAIKMKMQRRKSQEKENIFENQEKPLTEKDDIPEKPIIKVTSTWRLCGKKLFDWAETKADSKQMLKMRTAFENRHLGIFKQFVAALVFLGTIAILIAIAAVYFGLRFDKHEFLHTEIKFTPTWFQHSLPSVVITAMILGLVSLVVTIFLSIVRCFVKDYNLPLKVVSCLQTIFFGVVALWIFGITLVPLTELDLYARNKVPKIFTKQHSLVQKYNVFNAYGLFRSMTGIGGRPEVVIMGSDSLEQNSTWREYNFIYKPGNPLAAPTFNVPHQPRLDWQMWFAALGDYMSNPWFIQLTYKLLNGEEAVLDLLSTNPFKDKAPKYIRSVLFRYHFTRNQSSIFDIMFHHGHERRWWTREYVREYMPVVSKNDTMLKQILRRNGLIRSANNIQKTGLLHELIISTRRITRMFRTEFVIYMKFGFLVLIVALQYWWKTYALPKSRAKRNKIENMLKTKIFKFSTKLSKSEQQQ